MRHTMLAATALALAMAIGATSASAGEYAPVGAQITEARTLTSQEIHLGEATINCSEVKGTGVIASSTVALFRPVYSECHFGTGLSVTDEGCEDAFFEPEGSGPAFGGGVSVIDEPGVSHCQFNVYGEFLGIGCHVYFKPQGPLSTVIAESPGAGVIDLRAEIEGIAFTSEGSGCGIGTVPASGTNATYVGSVELTGEGITIQ